MSTSVVRFQFVCRGCKDVAALATQLPRPRSEEANSQPIA